MQLAWLTSRMSPDTDKFTAARKFLHAVISELADVNVLLIIYQQTVGITKLAGLHPLAADTQHELRRLAEQAKHLNAVIASVGNPHPIVGVDCHGLGPAKLPGVRIHDFPIAGDIYPRS